MNSHSIPFHKNISSMIYIMLTILAGIVGGGVLTKIAQKLMLKLGKQAVADVEGEFEKDLKGSKAKK